MPGAEERCEKESEKEEEQKKIILRENDLQREREREGLSKNPFSAPPEACARGLTVCSSSEMLGEKSNGWK